ncbi:MAG: BatA domain-containing protein [Acidobacteria bacterium]|nr:BatA domain-containing protein [Acidobacteriota bacterium]
MSFLAPLFFGGLAAIAVPIFVHLIQRERKQVVEFPSLMFLRRIPYESVERRRIHNWPLLLLRAGAMALIVAAFARPFFTESAAAAVAATTGSREVVILLDRSASMAYGDHWTRAQAEAQRVASGLSGQDRATLILFDDGVEEAVRATSLGSELQVAIRAAMPSARGTKYAPALRQAQTILSRSDRTRREAVLISDFQRTGWERQEDIRLPDGATITPVSVADPQTANLTVTSVAVQRQSFSGQERATLTAGLTNRSANPVANQAVRLEVDGRLIQTQTISLAPNASGTVSFDPITVAEANVQGAIRAGTDALPKDNDFYFVLSPSRSVSVLILHADGASSDASLYLTTGLGLSRTPPIAAEAVAVSRFTPAMLDGRSVVILNNASALSSVAAGAIAKFVDQGGGLFIVLGSNTPVSGDWPLMPGALGAPVDRTGLRGGTLGAMDSSHPIFQQFKGARTANVASTRFFRYRRIAVGPNDRVLARFDDGATAMAERRVGNGRVVVFTSTLDADWNDFPTHGMFLPILQETTRYLAQYTPAEPWHTVGRMLDISAPVAAIVREGQASRTPGGGSGMTGVAVSPSGRQLTLGGTSGAQSIELAEQGFYAVRLAGMGNQRPFAVAVNLDPPESDLATISPADLLAGMTNTAGTAVAGPSLEQQEPTAADMEKKQSLWWFLLVGGIALLLAEAIAANRLSRQLRPGLTQPGAAAARSIV